MKKGPQIAILRLVLKTVIMVAVVFGVYKVGTTVFQYTRELIGTDKGVVTATGETVKVEIPAGVNTKEIAEILDEKGLISSVTMFRLRSKMEGADGNFKHGTYSIDRGMDDAAIIELLQLGADESEQNKVTIPEGFTIKQIAERLEEKGIVKASDFMYEANNGSFNYNFLDGVPIRNNYLEGYLFPDTYFLAEETNAHEVIDKMLQRFGEVYASDIQQAVQNSDYTLDQIITIASIIEAEIKVPEEREIAAGVIYNRLDEDMPLQMCSTVLYAMGKRKDALLLSDLEIDSPYNTYQNAGLPIGPICNPGEAAIRAAAFPQDNDYYYFVLKAEDQGAHEFTKTYDEFLAAKERYKQQF